MSSKNKHILRPYRHSVVDKNGENNLPIEIQAFIEARVNTAMDAKRSDNIRTYIRYGITYAIVMIINFIIAVALWFYGPAEVKQWTRDFVAQNMNKPELESAAQKVVAEKMDEFATKKVKPLNEQFISLSKAIAESEKILKQLQDEQRLIALFNRAEIFDKEAVTKLEELSKGKTESAVLASSMLNKVQRTLVLDRNTFSYLIPLEKKAEAEYSGPFTNDELALMLMQPIPDGAINVIGDNKQLLFVAVLVDIAHISKDLWTINRIGNALKNMVNVDFYPWDLKPLDLWWEKNASKYPSWPFAEYAQALVAFHSNKYEEALPKFETILSIDPTADRSRALAVASAIEIGDLVKAKKLNVGYCQKDGRWELWAKCKMLLSTDPEEQTIKEFVVLAKKYPTITTNAWIWQGSHVFRKLDWAKYSELMKSDLPNSNKSLNPILKK